MDFKVGGKVEKIYSCVRSHFTNVTSEMTHYTIPYHNLRLQPPSSADESTPEMPKTACLPVFSSQYALFSIKKQKASKILFQLLGDQEQWCSGSIEVYMGRFALTFVHPNQLRYKNKIAHRVVASHFAILLPNPTYINHDLKFVQHT